MKSRGKHSRSGCGDNWYKNHGWRGQVRGHGRNFGNKTNNKAKKEIEIKFDTQTVSWHLMAPYNTVKEALINRIYKTYNHVIDIVT